MPGWEVARDTGAAGLLHARPLADPMARSVRILDVDGPALVLGSTQPDDVVDRAACEARGVAVVRRRSGGGAVLLEPGGSVWVDVELPRGDELWVDDVGRSTWWLGECWAAALGDGAAPGALTVHRGALVDTPWSRLVCFAGLGPGELTDAAGAKVLGVSQRRTRAGARFQCLVPLRWEPAALVELLAPAAVAAAGPTAELGAAVRPVGMSPPDVVDALLARLPA